MKLCSESWAEMELVETEGCVWHNFLGYCGVVIISDGPVAGTILLHLVDTWVR